MASRSVWERAQRDGAYRGSTLGADLEEVGFVHASTADQLPGVVERFYAGEDLADHVLLVVDVEACEAAGSPVRWEGPVEHGGPFPHVYGPVPLTAVVSTGSVERGPDGRLSLPELGGA
ncbi:DUF952 domain-containing protein [Quadrisphaera setariae]|uniref:DUF952 domain-containing protein n=1 Tax=Quadrisphaera setariae TaxID=2593304 RepID=A0A5C8ZKG2_9ACTN|nr:DUF952 domain-containing protein [Quadrisphaera setariae]TXR57608.1 DUF952 domain-containing protein [Quadrisphaera setariae]